MCDQCTCCPNTTEYIRQHLDPSALTKPDEDPREVLAIFQACFPGEELGIDVDDVRDYIEEIRQERASDLRLECRRQRWRG